MDIESKVESWSQTDDNDLVSFFRPMFRVESGISVDTVCSAWIAEIKVRSGNCKWFVIRRKRDNAILAVISVWEYKDHYGIFSQWAPGVRQEDKDCIRTDVETNHRKTIAPTHKTIWWIL